MNVFLSMQYHVQSMSHNMERASALDFKDTAALWFRHRDVVFVHFSNQHQKVLTVSH